MNREVIVEDAEAQDSNDAPQDDAGIDIHALVDAAVTEIAIQAREHPVRTLGIAAGVGYVLGGGLPRFVVRLGTAALVRTAARTALAMVPWSQLIESAMAPEPDPEPVARPRKKSAKKRTTRASSRR